MPTVRKTEIAALAIADLHLSDTTPPARESEEDWLAAMARPLQQLSSIQQALDVPVLIAGDLFNKSHANPATINFALTHLPDKCYAIPGNHDLPNHSYADIKRSAYWTLVEAGKISNISPGKPTIIEQGKCPLRVWGLPHGFSLTHCKPCDFYLEIALVHSYLWTANTGFHGASAEHRLAKSIKWLKTYDTAIYGDNHVRFLAKAGKASVLNCGAFIRRNINEMQQTPTVGLIMKDGSVKLHRLDCSGDSFNLTGGTEQNHIIDMSGVINQFESLAASGLDFESAVRIAVEDQPKEVATEIINAMGG